MRNFKSLKSKIAVGASLAAVAAGGVAIEQGTFEYEKQPSTPEKVAKDNKQKELATRNLEARSIKLSSKILDYASRPSSKFKLDADGALVNDATYTCSQETRNEYQDCKLGSKFKQEDMNLLLDKNKAKKEITIDLHGSASSAYFDGYGLKTVFTYSDKNPVAQEQGKLSVGDFKDAIESQDTLRFKAVTESSADLDPDDEYYHNTHNLKELSYCADKVIADDHKPSHETEICQNTLDELSAPDKEYPFAFEAVESFNADIAHRESMGQ